MLSVLSLLCHISVITFLGFLSPFSLSERNIIAVPSPQTGILKRLIRGRIIAPALTPLKVESREMAIAITLLSFPNSLKSE